MCLCTAKAVAQISLRLCKTLKDDLSGYKFYEENTFLGSL